MINSQMSHVLSVSTYVQYILSDLDDESSLGEIDSTDGLRSVDAQVTQLINVLLQNIKQWHLKYKYNKFNLYRYYCIIILKYIGTVTSLNLILYKRKKDKNYFVRQELPQNFSSNP